MLEAFNSLTPQKWMAFLGALLAFGSVAAGAFGAHALKNIISSEYLNVFETAARYQMYHAFAMFTVAAALGSYSHTFLMWAGGLFFFGTVIFSGSLYILALTGVRLWGAITPIGGTLILIGWACFAIGILKSKS
jgi:uncharacterized membrane protein YgdD (TMEM256/DUF423 family)